MPGDLQVFVSPWMLRDGSDGYLRQSFSKCQVGLPASLDTRDDAHAEIVGECQSKFTPTDCQQAKVRRFTR